MSTKTLEQAKTVRVRVNDGCFVTVDGVSISGNFQSVVMPDGKPGRRWAGAELWVTPAQAENWTVGTDPARPIVTIIGNRSLEDARAEETASTTSAGA